MNPKRTSKNECTNPSGDICNNLSAVVRLDMTVSTPNIMMPWQNLPQSTCSGSGVVIEEKYILTNAHNVTNATYIAVHKHNDDEEYEASILAIDHDCDFALLTIDKSSFFNGLRPMALGDTPPVRSRIQVAGYPLGGMGLSITRALSPESRKSHMLIQGGYCLRHNWMLRSIQEIAEDLSSSTTKSLELPSSAYYFHPISVI